MIRKLALTGVTVFPRQETFLFEPGINILVGGNDSGKSHIMRLCYAVCKWSGGGSRKELPVQWAEEKRLRLDVLRAFGLRDLNALVSRYPHAGAAEVHASLFGDKTPPGSAEVDFTFPADGEGLSITTMPERHAAGNAVFLAPQEVLSVFPCYMQVGKRYPELLDSAGWELCRALENEPTSPPAPALQHVLVLIEQLLRGKLVRQSGRFCLQRGTQPPMELMAEGFKRLGTLGLLVENGTVRQGTTLFWDEPEMNLNATHLPQLVTILLGLCRAGVQVLLTTHSLFLLRELTIQLATDKGRTVPHRFFGLQPTVDGVRVSAAEQLELLEQPDSLEAEMAQADRYLSLSNQWDN